MKRICAIFLFFMLCSLFAIGNETNATEISTIEEFEQTVESKLKAFDSQFTLTYVGDTDAFKARVGKIVSEFLTKNPVFNGYITKSGYSYVITNNVVEVTYTITYMGTKTQYDYVQTQVNALAKTIAAANKTQYAKVKAVNDYLAKQTEYKTVADRSHYSPYGVFKHKKAVCQGYTLAAHQLFEALGIEAQYVTGTAKGQSHAWNKVKIDGKWYNLDITWNDPVPNQPNQVLYNYFLLSDKALSATHKWDASKNAKATDTKYDFYKNTLYAVQLNQDVYYANKADNGRLYKYSIATAKNTKLSNARPMYIQAYKNTLYYSDYANSAYLTSANLQGKSAKVLVKSNVKNLAFKNNVLNYQINNTNKTLTMK